jgi:hypothetical protein
MADARLALGASAILGALYGALPLNHAQVAVEGAQILAGRVHYPPDNPFYVANTRIWTVLHQLGGSLLALGMDEWTLSRCFAALGGALAFAGVCGLVLALSDRPLLSVLLTPLAIVIARHDGQGFGYPVLALGTSHTYGVVAIGWVLLSLALFGVGSTRIGAFCAGLAPCVHPSLGPWVAVCLAAAALVSAPSRAALLDRRVLAWFGAGALASVASLVSYRSLSEHRPTSPEADAILDTFLALWDVHRAPLPWNGAAIAAVVAATLLAVVASQRSPVMSVALASSAVVATAAILAFALVRRAGVPLPAFAEMLMPARYLDLTLLAAQPLVLGMLLRHADRPVHAVALAAYVALAWASLVARGGAYEVTAAFSIVAMILPRVPEGAARAWLLALPALASLVAWRPIARATFRALDDPPPATLFAHLGPDTETIVSESDLHLVQLHTRQRILLDGGALDQLPYAPEIGPDMVAILRDVYGVDFDRPTELHTAKIPEEPARTVWARRTREEWSLLARRYGFTKVLTRESLRLDLDPLGTQSGLVLWNVQ